MRANIPKGPSMNEMLRQAQKMQQDMQTKQAELEENLTEAHTLGYSENEIAESETMFMKFEKVYFSMLDQEEIQIYKSRMQGCTTQMIAKDLGYKSHSAIVKKLKKMRKKFDEMCKAINKTK